MALERIESWLGHMAILFAGGFMALETFAWPATTAAALGFAISIGVGVVATALTGVSVLRGHVPQAALSGAIAVLAAWTIVATRVFVPSTAVWLAFASAFGYVGLATIGLLIHELSSERVVHHLEVGETERAKAIVS